MGVLAAAMRAAVLQASRRESLATTAGPVVAVADLKRHVSQVLDDDDTLLTTFEAIALQWVEQYLGRTVLQQTWREWFDGPFCGPVLLLKEQASAVASLTVYDPNDATTVVSSDVYQVDLVSAPSRLVLREGQTWPVDLRQANAIAVQYTAGWATADDVPELVKAAIVLHVAHQYRYREPVEDGAVVRVPYGIESLLRPWRLRTGVA